MDVNFRGSGGLQLIVAEALVCPEPPSCLDDCDIELCFWERGSSYVEPTSGGDEPSLGCTPLGEEPTFCREDLHDEYNFEIRIDDNCACGEPSSVTFTICEPGEEGDQCEVNREGVFPWFAFGDWNNVIKGESLKNGVYHVNVDISFGSDDDQEVDFKFEVDYDCLKQWFKDRGI